MHSWRSTLLLNQGEGNKGVSVFGEEKWRTNLDYHRN